MPSRPYSGDGDLLRMQEVAVARAAADGEFAHSTAGDLAWWMWQHENKLDEVRIELWEDERGSVVAWAWLWLPGVLILQTRPGADHVRPAILDWFEGAAPGYDEGVYVSAIDTDAVLVSLLESRGYAPVAEDAMVHLVMPLAGLREPEVHEGYTLRPVEPHELAERAAVHASAFAPSRVTAASYAQVVRAPPYLRELDWVAVAPNGSFAAFALAWLDEQNRLAELEPVGTHPDHRRRGLAAGVCAAALRAAHHRGAETGLVYANEGAPAVTLYTGLGFRQVASHVQFRKPRTR